MFDLASVCSLVLAILVGTAVDTSRLACPFIPSIALCASEMPQWSQ